MLIRSLKYLNYFVQNAIATSSGKESENKLDSKSSQILMEGIILTV